MQIRRTKRMGGNHATLDQWSYALQKSGELLTSGKVSTINWKFSDDEMKIKTHGVTKNVSSTARMYIWFLA